VIQAAFPPGEADQPFFNLELFYPSFEKYRHPTDEAASIRPKGRTLFI